MVDIEQEECLVCFVMALELLLWSLPAHGSPNAAEKHDETSTATVLRYLQRGTTWLFTELCLLFTFFVGFGLHTIEGPVLCTDQNYSHQQIST